MEEWKSRRNLSLNRYDNLFLSFCPSTLEMTTRPDLESNAKIPNFLSSKGEINSNENYSHLFSSFVKEIIYSCMLPAPTHNHSYRKTQWGWLNISFTTVLSSNLHPTQSSLVSSINIAVECLHTCLDLRVYYSESLTLSKEL